MKAIWAVGIMAVMAVLGFFVGATVSNSDVAVFSCAILFAMISGIGCIIQAIHHNPNDKEK